MNLSGPAGEEVRDASAPWREALIRGLWVGVGLLFLLSLVSFVTWRSELAEIRRIVAPHIDETAEPLEIMYQARDFMRDHVGYGRSDDYFLLPIFGFMRPTALQVIEAGGDCAYRSRAFIVILRSHGIRAHKRALYNPRGTPVHAVVETEINDGAPYFVDLLFNVVHTTSDGNPLSLPELAIEDTLRASLARATLAGNERASRYPITAYTFGDVRTLNWDKLWATKMVYQTLVLALGEDRAREIPRPYLSEEPALMVIMLSLTGAGFMLFLIVLVKPRTGSTIPQAGGPSRATTGVDEQGLALQFASPFLGKTWLASRGWRPVRGKHSVKQFSGVEWRSWPDTTAVASASKRQLLPCGPPPTPDSRTLRR